MRDLQNRINLGEPVDFGNDVHLAAVLLKTFLRELEEPLMTFDLFDEITQFQSKIVFVPFVHYLLNIYGIQNCYGMFIRSHIIILLFKFFCNYYS